MKDGIIDDPRRCHFDPAKLLCKRRRRADLPDRRAGGAAKKIYDGVKNPRTGEQIFTGWPRGSEGFGDSAGTELARLHHGSAGADARRLLQYFLFHDPNWDYRSIDWERDLAYAEQKLPFMAAVDKDLTPFKKRGGKLLMYTGWSDPVVPPQDTVAYYEGVVKAMGGLEKTREFYRFFTRARHGPLRRRPRPEPVRSPDARSSSGSRRASRRTS